MRHPIPERGKRMNATTADTANRSGLQMATIRNVVMAWVLLLPVSILVSGVLYMLLSAIY
jgi:phosphate/sulfate permease